MRFDREQKAHIDALIEGRVQRERRRHAHQIAELTATINHLQQRRLGARLRRWLHTHIRRFGS